MGRWLSFAALLLAAPASGEDCKTAFARSEISPEYISIVDTYRNRQWLVAVQSVARLDHKALESFVKQLEPAPMDEHSHPCVEAAALLHTDTAIYVVEDGDWTKAFVHFELGRTLSRKVGRHFERDWLLAVALYYQGLIFAGDREIGFREATALFDDALDRHPADAEILVAAGALWEWSGSLPFGEPDHMKRAERLYARALEQEPGLAEAKLRYGNVLEKRGRFDDAVQHPEPAILHYQAAIKLEPNWQIGFLALSHALHTASEREASRTALEEALILSDSKQSGWWEYELGLSERADPLFSSMREALAR